MKNIILVKPIQAELTRDVEWLGKMDPYVNFKLGGESVKSSVCKSGGKTPYWDDALELPKTNGNTLFVDIYDSNILRKDTHVAGCEINLGNFLLNGAANRWFDLFHNEIPVGRILLDICDQSFPKAANIIGSSGMTGVQQIPPFGQKFHHLGKNLTFLVRLEQKQD